MQLQMKKRKRAMVYAIQPKVEWTNTSEKGTMIWSASLMIQMRKISVFPLPITPGAEPFMGSAVERFEKEGIISGNFWCPRSRGEKPVNSSFPQDGATLFCIDRQMPKIMIQNRWSQRQLPTLCSLYSWANFESTWPPAEGLCARNA